MSLDAGIARGLLEVFRSLDSNRAWHFAGPIDGLDGETSTPGAGKVKRLEPGLDHAVAVGEREHPEASEVKPVLYQGEVLLEIWHKGTAQMYRVTGETL